ncbi:MAG: hypothetical protein PSV22_24900 [Pseudolabrys sp.]|nr:hypothetical protein [Pseudolabrys sp.]
MTGDESGKKQKKSGAPNSRDARLAAALRENLRRRKAQERARGANERGREAQTEPGDSKITSGDENA